MLTTCYFPTTASAKAEESTLPHEKKRKTETCVTSKPLADALVEEVSYLCQFESHVDSDRNEN